MKKSRSLIYNIHYCYEKLENTCFLIKAFLIRFSFKNFNWNIVQKIIDSICGLKFNNLNQTDPSKNQNNEIIPALVIVWDWFGKEKKC